MFNKMNQNGTGESPPAKAKGKGTIEKIYQKKSQLEHILLRPDTYIGSVERATETMWVYDKTKECMVQRELNFVPGIYTEAFCVWTFQSLELKYKCEEYQSTSPIIFGLYSPFSSFFFMEAIELSLLASCLP